MSIDPDVDIRYMYVTGSIPDPVDFEIGYFYSSGSIPDPVDFEIYATHHPDTGSQLTGLQGVVDVLPTRYSGSQSTTQSIYQDQVKNCCYKRVIYHYSASGTFSTKYLKQWYTAVSKSQGLYYSRSLECAGYQIHECSTQNNVRFNGSRLEGPGINVDSPNTVDGGPVVTIKISNDVSLLFTNDESSGNLKIK